MTIVRVDRPLTLILYPPSLPVPVAEDMDTPNPHDCDPTTAIELKRWRVNGSILPGFALYFPGTDTVYATKEFPEWACASVAGVKPWP
jgi:hypothetical protein